MAELTGLILAIAGGVDVAARTFSAVTRLIHEWKDAPVQVTSLFEEIGDSRHVAMQLKEFCEKLHGNDSLDAAYIATISSQVRRAEPLWIELEKIVRSLWEPAGRLRKERWLKSAHKIASMQGKLRELRFATLEILSIYTASRTVRIESAIAMYQNSQETWNETTTHSISDILSRLEVGRPPANQAVHSPGQKLLQRHIDENDSSSDCATTGVIENIWVTMRYLDGPGPRCNFRCPCRCHTGKRYGRFRVAPFEGVLGSLSIVYSGWQFAGPRCNLRTCHRARFKLLEVTYTTPVKPISISIVASLRLRDGEPTIGLTIGRTVNIINEHDSQSIISLSKAGNVSEVRRRLERRPDAVLDVSNWDGSSSLHNALDHGYLAMVHVLLAAGADPFLEDDWGYPAIFEGFQRMLREDRSTQEDVELKSCLPMSAFFDDYGFSHVERVVLGVRPLNLQVELDKAMCRAEVNAKDDMGMTPLHWAAIRSDSSAVIMLLEAGAHVDTRSKRDRTALYEACYNNSEGCAEKLIAFGADVNAQYKLGYGPMHAAATGNASRGLLSLLLSNGADIDDSRNTFSTTPLGRAIACDNTRSCRNLLELGADLEHADWEGETPLYEAVSWNAHACLQLLLSWNADYLHKNSGEQTLLHIAAMNGDDRTFEILAAANLRGLDANAKDMNSMNARQHFAARSGAPREAKESFEALMESFLRANAEVEEHIGLEISDDEEFVDALENND